VLSKVTFQLLSEGTAAICFVRDVVWLKVDAGNVTSVGAVVVVFVVALTVVVEVTVTVGAVMVVGTVTVGAVTVTGGTVIVTVGAVTVTGGTVIVTVGVDDGTILIHAEADRNTPIIIMAENSRPRLNCFLDMCYLQVISSMLIIQSLFSRNPHEPRVR
jgi:hypothetical protein